MTKPWQEYVINLHSGIKNSRVYILLYTVQNILILLGKNGQNIPLVDTTDESVDFFVAKVAGVDTNWTESTVVSEIFYVLIWGFSGSIESEVVDRLLCGLLFALYGFD